MELIRIVENFQPKNDDRLLRRAAELAPTLLHRQVSLVGAFRLGQPGKMPRIPLEELPSLALGKGEHICLDFGTHYVGYLTLKLGTKGSHPDAPAHIRLNFAERREELLERAEDYHGWVSGSWIQQEQIHVDDLPSVLNVPRRFAFRYVMLTVLDTSPKFQITLQEVRCRTESAVDLQSIDLPKTGNDRLDTITQISLRTLANCMQDVFEDGPKRDQRLWMGDLRLQALTNYISFRHYDLVKRCLYLFAGSRFPDGKVSACVFTRGEVAADDTYLADYSLMFTVALEEYLEQTDDREALDDLYAIAVEQIDIALNQCDEGGIISSEFGSDTFVDWCDGLDKQGCAQAILLYTVCYGILLAQRKGDAETAERLTKAAEQLKQAAKTKFWCQEKEVFVSNGQISPATQIWMVLAGVTEGEQAAKLMSHCRQYEAEFPMQSPYMHHYYTAALLKAGLKDMAFDHIQEYWGSMVDLGADTFWETWNPKDPHGSPYGGQAVNSFCHAWSCTPAYLMETHLN